MTQALSRRGFLTGAAALLASTAVARVAKFEVGGVPTELRRNEKDVTLTLRYFVKCPPSTGRTLSSPSNNSCAPASTLRKSWKPEKAPVDMDFEVIERRALAHIAKIPRPLLTDIMANASRLDYVMIDPLSEFIGKTFTGRVSYADPATSNKPKRGGNDAHNFDPLRKVQQVGRNDDADPRSRDQLTSYALGSYLSRRGG